MPTDEQAVRDTHDAWINAVNAGQIDWLLAHMADDVVLINPGGEPLDKAGFPAKFLGGHRQFRLRCESELQEVVVVGDLAYTRAKDTLTLTPHTGGDTTRLTGHRLTIYRKKEGRWLLARDAHTLGAE